MPKLIKDWDDLDGLVSEDGKYKIEVEENRGCGWIVPTKETAETERDYWKHHTYLSTHTFYGKFYKNSEETLLRFGFDVKLESWDKEGEE